MHFRDVRTWAVGFSILVASLQTGCALSPATQQNGLPRISRYTNSLQLNWALSRYAELAADPTSNAGSQACQGWRRMTFDLASARTFPAVFRIGADSAGLLAALDELPAAVARHPLPASCTPQAGVGAQVPSAVSPVSVPVPEVVAPSAPSAAPAAPSVVADAGQVPAGGSPDGAPAQQTSPPAASTTIDTPTPPATVTPVPLPAAPIQAVTASVSPVPMPSTPLSPSPGQPDEEAQQWQRLVTASAVPMDHPASQRVPEPQANLAELAALAESSIPTIRLRARYHLLGHCASAIAQSDRLGKTAISTGPTCWGNDGREPLRVTQSRLLWSMLKAWRGRRPEPFSDLVAALASFASRDNPVLDGPRISR